MLRRKNILSFFRFILLLTIFSLVGCQNLNKEQREQELIEKIEIPSVVFRSTDNSEQILKGMTEEEKESFIGSLDQAVFNHFEKNKDLKIKDTVIEVLKEYDIDLAYLDVCKLSLSSFEALDQKKYDIKFSGLGISYPAGDGNENEDYFPGKTDKEFTEILDKITYYANEAAKKGQTVKLDPETMEKLGIDSYNEDKLGDITIRYNYIRDIE